MNRLYQPAVVKELLREVDFKFSKRFGQNFLIDGNIIRKIVDVSEIDENSTVVEIGTGIGTLTEELALRGSKVHTFEVDRKLEPIIKKTLGKYENVEVHFKDILEENLASIFSGEENISVVANLPYYITTPIILRLLEYRHLFNSITIMVQKEVADRICASSGNKDYGSLSIYVQYYCNVSYDMKVPASVFMPAPKVDSAVITLRVKEELEDIDETLLFKIVRGAFSMRRKTILNTLSSSMGISKDEVREILNRVGIETNRRAEDISIEEYKLLCRNWVR